MKLSIPFALQFRNTAAGARRQGSSTSALTRGLDGARRRPSDAESRAKGITKGPASATVPQLKERRIHKKPDTTRNA